MNFSPEQWSLLVPFLSGGVAGAFFTHYFTTTRQRTEFAFKLLEHYFSKYQEIGAVKGFLKLPTSLDDVATCNRVLAVGDWYDTVALLCRRQIANRHLLIKAGLIGEMEVFCTLAEKTGGRLIAPLDAWVDLRAITGKT